MNLKRFPPNLNRFGWKSTKSVSWDVTLQRSGSRLKTFTTQTVPVVSITTKVNRLTDDEARQLLGFIVSVKGAACPFLWRDPEDFRVKSLKGSHADGLSWVLDDSCLLNAGALSVDMATVYVNGVALPDTSFSVDGKTVTVKEGAKQPNGQDITSATTVTADVVYSWVVHFKEDSFSVEKEYLNFNRSKEFTMETWVGVV